MKIILGASGTSQDGWISTDKADLDLTSIGSFSKYFGLKNASAFLAEHVFEHLSMADGLFGMALCRQYLVEGGTLRIAVPDKLHSDPEYIRWTEPGGVGPGADDHKVFYDLETLCSSLAQAGFTKIRPIEWWGGDRRFHALPWSPEQGLVRRSLKHDSRNLTRPIPYTSLIVDAVR